MNPVVRAMTRNAVGLALFALITAGTIALTHGLTQDRIAKQEARAESRALFQIVPETQHTNDLLSDTLTLPATPALGLDQPATAHLVRREGRVTGLILPVIAPDGYSGDINLLVGIDRSGDVLGVRVTRHQETPGLGDKIETRKSDWVRDFAGKELGQPPAEEWTVAKDGGAFDQFTGATITPRAVVHAVREALVYFRSHRETLLAGNAPTPTEETD
ncbi:electron transport complex protein RnfG [Tamilnaduibacter salinus]|uniref:Ion-translocating oxidoreductase complex subunit G n=1 Tax=Tamilnaduibacter salinus TaxID=1484056 RepID=A0A2U1CT75_9GAMM|nr:electron transport complex subunit RsxG [Tamilnaduibacter salinus]PVY69633.1 electron transport complex protein RnfG [Tamilnaduibacter salinus]